jgi:hypothetical protein
MYFKLFFFKFPSHGEVDGQSPAWISQRFSLEPIRYIFIVQEGGVGSKGPNALYETKPFVYSTWIWQVFYGLTAGFSKQSLFQ